MVSVFGAVTHDRKTRIWTLWRQGRPMSEIARDISKPPATVYSYLLYHGGIEPRRRTRRMSSLSHEEREAISRGLASGTSMRRIALELGRSPSTISREVARNGGVYRYRANAAETAFLRRSRRPKVPILARNPALCRVVTRFLEQDWSPEQISGWLREKAKSGGDMSISHETIYRSLFIQTRGVLREELKKHLRTRRMFRRSKGHKGAGQSPGPYRYASVRPKWKIAPYPGTGREFLSSAEATAPLRRWWNVTHASLCCVKSGAKGRWQWSKR